MNKPFIVAELSGNHRGQLSHALALVDAAAEAGADAVKIQTFTPEQMADQGVVIETGPWAGRELLDLYRETYYPRDWHAPIFSRAKLRGLIAFSSVFHKDDVDFLETLDCPIYKISSFEITDLPLIGYAASKGKPLIISAGMATFGEIEEALTTAISYSPGDIAVEVTILKCTSAYPAKIADTNLATMADIQKHLKWIGPQDVGLSDHTMGLACAVAATVLGATVIEKHLTLARADGGPDALFSAEPHEFKAMVKACREAAQAIGHVQYGPTPAEQIHVNLRRRPGMKRGTPL